VGHNRAQILAGEHCIFSAKRLGSNPGDPDEPRFANVAGRHGHASRHANHGKSRREWTSSMRGSKDCE
jgi:hypothetical protein